MFMFEGTIFCLLLYVHTDTHMHTHVLTHITPLQCLLPFRTESPVCCITENSIHLLCLRTLFNYCASSCNMVMGVFFSLSFFPEQSKSVWFIKFWTHERFPKTSSIPTGMLSFLPGLYFSCTKLAIVVHYATMVFSCWCGTHLVLGVAMNIILDFLESIWLGCIETIPTILYEYSDDTREEYNKLAECLQQNVHCFMVKFSFCGPNLQK